MKMPYVAPSQGIAPRKDPAGLLDLQKTPVEACWGAPGKFQVFLVRCICLQGQALSKMAGGPGETPPVSGALPHPAPS